MIKDKSFFSVIIPLYNKEGTIERAVNSVLNQTFNKFELIIINDGSTDLSLNKIINIKDDRIRIVNKENKGVSSARNLGIKMSISNWICFLDADDYWENNFLEKFHKQIVNNIDIGFIFSSYFVNEKPIKVVNIDDAMIVNHFFNQIRKFGVSPNSSSVAVKKCCFDKIGLFEEYITIGEDTDMWYRLMWSCKTMYIPELLSHIFFGDSNWAKYENYPSYWFFRFNQWKKEERLSKNKIKEFRLLYNRQLLKYLLFDHNFDKTIYINKPEYDLVGIGKLFIIDIKFVISLIYQKIHSLYV